MLDYPSCPKCQGVMEPGYFLDHAHSGWTTVRWVEGEPKKSIWTGLKVNLKQAMRIATYRCIDCGFLESYARPEPPSEAK